MARSLRWQNYHRSAIECHRSMAGASSAKTALNRRRQSEQQRLQRLDLLEYQVRELGEAHLADAGELEHLEQESIRLSHIVELQQQSYRVFQALYQNEGDTTSAADLLSKAEVILHDLAVYDVQLQPILEMVTDALAQAAEASRQISSYGEQLEADPQRLEEVEDRIRELKQICRNYAAKRVDSLLPKHPKRIKRTFRRRGVNRSLRTRISSLY